MADLEISKLDAARRQLEAAIRLYFNGGDAIAIHTLAAAAANVLSNLCAHREVQHPWSLDVLIEQMIKPEHKKEVRAKFREPENFFKHADRDPNEVLKFNPEATEYLLFEAEEAYSTLTNERVPVFIAYRGWWMLRHQHLIKNAPEQLKSALQLFKYGPNQRTEYFAEAMAIIARLPG